MASSKYEILQSWYLARLRKVALDSIAADGLTPQALILADRELVEKLIAEKSQENAEKGSENLEAMSDSLPKWGASKSILSALGLMALVQVVSLVLLLMQVKNLPASDPANAALMATVIGLTIVALLFIGLAYFLLTGWFTVPLQLALKRSKSKVKGIIEVPAESSGVEIQELLALNDALTNALIEVSEREKAIADYSADIICSLDPEGKVLASNTAFFRLLGYGVVGKTADRILFPEDAEKLKAVLNFVKEKGSTRSIDVRALKKDGSVCDLKWTVEWSGTQNQFFCIVSDISVSKELERVKSEFVHMISHDLRTPLSSLQFSLEVIESGIYGQLAYEGRKSLSGAQRSIERLISLIGQLLDLDKCESGHLELDLKVVALADILSAGSDQLGGFASMNKIKLVTAKTDQYVWAESGRLAQVVINLVSNAIKYSPPESTVEIKTTDMVDLIQVEVIDKGKGIPHAYQNLIFDRYRQVDVTDSSEKKGSGLGLAICKALVTVHGGSIGVESEEGKGSKFWFRVRKASDEDVAKAKEEEKALEDQAREQALDS